MIDWENINMKIVAAVIIILVILGMLYLAALEFGWF